MNTLKWFFLVSLGLASSLPLAQVSRENLFPVPAPQLKGNVLTDEPLNFSIEAPSAEWQWMMINPVPSSLAGGYACINEKEGTSYQILIPRSPLPLNEKIVKEAANGVENSVREKGYTLKDIRVDKTSNTLSGSYRISASFITPDDEQGYFFNYLVPIGSITVYQSEPEESPQFQAFVGSLKLLKAKSNTTNMTIYLLLLFPVYLLCLLINSVSETFFVNWGKAALGFYFIVMIMNVIIAVGGKNRSQTQEQMNEGLSQVFADLFFPVLVSFFVARKITKQKEEEEQQEEENEQKLLKAKENTPKTKQLLKEPLQGNFTPKTRQRPKEPPADNVPPNTP